MLLRKLVVVGLVGFVSFAANIATAEDAVGPSAAFVGANGVSFIDPNSAFEGRFNLDLSEAAPQRFSGFAPADPTARSRERAPDYRRYEVSLVASSDQGLDVSFAQHGGVGFNEHGDVDRRSRGSELRLGSGLRNMPRDQPSSEPRWYVFAASEDEALIWRPGVSSGFGQSGSSFALQDRVEIGDLQAGVTYETHGWQASFAYVEREIKVRAGHQSFSQDEDFTGITLTMRH